jgi:hypothetical protein
MERSRLCISGTCASDINDRLIVLHGIAVTTSLGCQVPRRGDGDGLNGNYVMKIGDIVFEFFSI